MSDPSTTTALPSSLRMTVWEGSTDTKNKKDDRVQDRPTQKTKKTPQPMVMGMELTAGIEPATSTLPM